MDKYLSIITNFGCHYTCPYCVVKNNHLDIPQTTLEGLNNLNKSIQESKANIISLSGGGDPLFQYYRHKDWYEKLYAMTNLPLEMHTSYLNLPEGFDIGRYTRIVYHISPHGDSPILVKNAIRDLMKVRRYGNEIVRVVFVITGDYSEFILDTIAYYIKNNKNIDELSFRQLIDNTYTPQTYLQDYLRAGHKKKWWYIEQGDYNLYYSENKVYTSYKELGRHKEE